MWKDTSEFAWICSGMAMPSSCSLRHTHCTWGPEREGRSQNHLRPLMRFMSQRYSCYLLLCVRAITKKNEASALYCKGAVVGEARDVKFFMGCTGKAEYGECKTAWLTHVPGAKYVGYNLLHILTVSILWLIWCTSEFQLNVTNYVEYDRFDFYPHMNRVQS